MNQIFLLLQNFGMTESTQTKIVDSKSWVSCLKHITKQSCGHQQGQENEQKASQTQYVIASTFDKWLSLKTINCHKIYWQRFTDMKMTMPVVNACIEFNEDFKPLNLVIAYFDGSIECCAWDKINRLYSVEIEGGKKRELTKTLPQVLKEIQRPTYINLIHDESESIQETFMLETVCFLHKHGQYLYAINLKGQLKIFKVLQTQKKLQLRENFRFGTKIVQAQLLPKYGIQKNYVDDCFLVAICFERVSVPIVLQISPKITYEEIKLKIQKIYQKFPRIQKEERQNIKHINYDPKTQSLITCSEKNQISIFSLEKQEFMQKNFILVPQVEKIFHLESKSTIESVNDLSIKDNRLLILCNQSFFIYDIADGLILNEGQRLRQTLDMGKLVSYTSEKGKPILLIKKKFNYLDPKQRSSTTLHLFMGK